MSFIRVQIWDDTSYYTFPINPVEFLTNDNDVFFNIDTLDGMSIQQKPFFDNRPKVFTWKNLPQKDPYKAMVDKLKTFKGSVRNMKLNRLDFDSNTVLVVKILDVSTTLMSGSASIPSSTYKMGWAEVVLTFVEVRQV